MILTLPLSPSPCASLAPRLAVEKGSEVGAHILSGNVFEPRALSELFPNYSEMDDPPPLETLVTEDKFLALTETGSVQIPNLLLPSQLHNDGNYVISLNQLVRWLGAKAEEMEIEVRVPQCSAAERSEVPTESRRAQHVRSSLLNSTSSLYSSCLSLLSSFAPLVRLSLLTHTRIYTFQVFAGFSASEVLYDDSGNVRGIATRDVGIGKDGEKKDTYERGMELRARQTLFAEGARGSCSEEIMEKFGLREGVQPQVRRYYMALETAAESYRPQTSTPRKPTISLLTLPSPSPPPPPPPF